MLLYAEALRLIRDAARRRGVLPEEEVALTSALGRVTSRPIAGAEPIPPFDNSAMDGYALAAAKTAPAPARLPVLGTVLAGDAPKCAVESGGAWRIMTGAPLPAGCDAVVPVESSRELEGGRLVEILSAAEPGDYIRARGRDFAAGAEVCPAGTRLGPRHLLALAAVGAARVRVRRRPRAALLATGRELVAPDKTPGPGQIRDASSAYLAATLPALGADFEFGGIVADDPADFKRRLEALTGCDLVLTTGAVSMGTADFIPAALKDSGAEVVFHKTSIRPGKPVFCARLPNGPLFFGLPGNPISTVVGLRFFVEPCLRELLGRPVELPSRSRLRFDVDKPEGLRCFFKARRTSNDTIEVLPGQASFQIQPLLSADCWAVLEEDGDHLKAGTEIDVYPLSDALS